MGLAKVLNPSYGLAKQSSYYVLEGLANFTELPIINGPVASA
jgi:hypothetical protein